MHHQNKKSFLMGCYNLAVIGTPVEKVWPALRDNLRRLVVNKSKKGRRMRRAPGDLFRSK